MDKIAPARIRFENAFVTNALGAPWRAPAGRNLNI
jgi:hypothetical protein